MKSKWTGKDKIFHLEAGMIVAALAYGLMVLFAAINFLDMDNMRKFDMLLLSAVAAFAAGFAKELNDSRHTGNFFDPKDLIVTAGGGILACLIISITNFWIVLVFAVVAFLVSRQKLGK